MCMLSYRLDMGSMSVAWFHHVGVWKLRASLSPFIDRYTNPAVFVSSVFRAFSAGDMASRAGSWANPTTGVARMFHTGLWGGWLFSITGYNSASQSFSVTGGWQEARGSDSINGNQYYVENIKV